MSESFRALPRQGNTVYIATLRTRLRGGHRGRRAAESASGCRCGVAGPWSITMLGLHKECNVYICSRCGNLREWRDGRYAGVAYEAAARWGAECYTKILYKDEDLPRQAYLCRYRRLLWLYFLSHRRAWKVDARESWPCGSRVQWRCPPSRGSDFGTDSDDGSSNSKQA